VALVGVLLHGMQLLRPVRTRIAHIPPNVLWATEGFVRIANAVGECARHRDCLEDQQKYDRIPPAAAVPDQHGDRARDQDCKKDVDGQNVPNADVHSALHRRSQVNERRDQQKQEFAPLLQLPASDHPNANRQHDQECEARFHQHGHWKVKPDRMRVGFAEEVAVEVVGAE